MNGFEFTLTPQILTPQILAAAIGALVVVAAIGFAIWKYLKGGITPEERERQRRVLINSSGKLGDGEIIDIEGSVIVFSYAVGGVAYTSSQDASSLMQMLPDDAMATIGPASVKFDPRNPANSIVICEDWIGLRSQGRSLHDKRTHAR